MAQRLSMGPKGWRRMVDAEALRSDAGRRRRSGLAGWWALPIVALIWILIVVVLATCWGFSMHGALLLTAAGLSIGLLVNLLNLWTRV